MLKKKEIPDEKTLYEQLVKEYQERYQLKWMGLYGFNNTYGIAVTKGTAERYHLENYADLASVSSKLSFGAEYDYYERDDGYDVMAKENDFHFKKTMDLDIGLKYDALLSGEVDVILVFTTDGRLADPNLVVLEDQESYFETYEAGTVIREETLEKYPQLASVIALLDHQISETEMAQMNNAVETEGMEDVDVARAFLVKKHLLEVSDE